MGNEIINDQKPDGVSSKGIALPLKTGTVGDNLSASFIYFKDIIIDNLKLITGSLAVLVVLYVSLSVFIRKTEVWTAFSSTFSSAIDSSQAGMDEAGMIFFKKFMLFYQEMSVSGFFFFFFLPFFYPVLYYMYHRLFRKSEAFADLPKRGFWGWLFMQFITLIVGGVMYLLLSGIFGGIITLVTVILMKAGTAGIILSVLIIIAGVVCFIMFSLLCIALVMLAKMLTLFKRTGPFRAIRLALKTMFNAAGTRKGGVMGLNAWHLVGLGFLVGLISMGITSILYMVMVPVIFIIPVDSANAQIAFSSFYLVLILAVTFFQWMLELLVLSVYLSENMVFNSYPMRDELIRNAE